MPLPAPLAIAIVLKCTAAGIDDLHRAAPYWLCSVLVEAGYFGLLRPCEVLELRRDIVAFPSVVALLHSAFAVCAGNAPKNKHFMGRKKFGIVRSSNASLWLKWISEGLLGSMKFWPCIATLFRSIFQEAVLKLGLQAWNLQFSSLRTGGATHFYVEGVEVSRLKFWGRWASEKSLAYYLQEAISALLVLNCHYEVNCNISAALRYGSKLMVVPDVPWWKHFSWPHMRFIQVSRASTKPSCSLPEDRRSLYPAPNTAGHEP